MKCPKCHKEGCKYITKRAERILGADKKTIPPRTDFRAKCYKCNWEGTI
jgi:hypothetical protein